MSIESVMPSNHLILCRPLLLPSVFPSIRIFSNESVLCIWWPKYWSFSFSIRPSSEYSGLISFRIGWFDLLAVQGSLPQPSLSPRAGSNSCPSTQRCHPTISSSAPFYSYPQSFPSSQSFQMSQLFVPGDQSIGVSALASVLPMNIQD